MKLHHLSLLAAGLLAASSASALLNIPKVFVGDAGNAADSTGFGGVSYDYHIGTYEVTNAQYASFLNSVDPSGSNPFGIYNSSMGSSALGGISFSAGAPAGARYSTRPNMDNKPVNYVSFWDAARFTNWLTTGSTETGVYNLGSVTNPTNSTITRDNAAWLAGGVAIASENEWYKAAYYDGAGDYWLYPTQSDSAPIVATANSTGDVTNPGANVANYNDGADWNSQDGNVTTVGSAAAASYYGTFDQGGNLWEWNDEILSTSTRGLRGGSFFNGDIILQSSFRIANDPSVEGGAIGFRVSSLAAIPEPSHVGGLMGALALLMAWRVRGRRTL